MIYRDPQWDWRGFDLERDAVKANAANKDIDELDPHLAPFAKHGGKLLIYHGWADQQVAPRASVEFYKSVLKLSSDSPAHASNWIRLFMVPGMGHCSGGEGPDTFNKIAVLEHWVEQGKAPANFTAAPAASIAPVPYVPIPRPPATTAAAVSTTPQTLPAIRPIDGFLASIVGPKSPVIDGSHF